MEEDDKLKKSIKRRVITLFIIGGIGLVTCVVGIILTTIQESAETGLIVNGIGLLIMLIGFAQMVPSSYEQC